jgi:hypothetical protein
MLNAGAHHVRESHSQPHVFSTHGESTGSGSQDTLSSSDDSEPEADHLQSGAAKPMHRRKASPGLGAGLHVKEEELHLPTHLLVHLMLFGLSHRNPAVRARAADMLTVFDAPSAPKHLSSDMSTVYEEAQGQVLARQHIILLHSCALADGKHLNPDLVFMRHIATLFLAGQVSANLCRRLQFSGLLTHMLGPFIGEAFVLLRLSPVAWQSSVSHNGTHSVTWAHIAKTHLHCPLCLLCIGRPVSCALVCSSSRATDRWPWCKPYVQRGRWRARHRYQCRDCPWRCC